MAKGTVVNLEWINGGEDTTLGSIPIKGERRLETMRAEGAAIAALDTNAFLTHLRACIIMAVRLLEKDGVEEAHRNWNIAFGAQYENLRWSVEDFEASIKQTLQDYVLVPLGVTDIDAAEKELKKQAKEINASVRKVRGQRDEWLQDLRLEEVFWLLWRSKPRPDFMPVDTKVPSDSDIASSKEVISYFLDDEDYGVFMKAIRGNTPLKANIEALASQASAEVVQKKASRTSKPSTKR